MKIMLFYSKIMTRLCSDGGGLYTGWRFHANPFPSFCVPVLCVRYEHLWISIGWLEVGSRWVDQDLELDSTTGTPFPNGQVSVCVGVLFYTIVFISFLKWIMYIIHNPFNNALFANTPSMIVPEMSQYTCTHPPPVDCYHSQDTSTR